MAVPGRLVDACARAFRAAWGCEATVPSAFRPPADGALRAWLNLAPDREGAAAIVGAIRARLREPPPAGPGGAAADLELLRVEVPAADPLLAASCPYAIAGAPSAGGGWTLVVPFDCAAAAAGRELPGGPAAEDLAGWSTLARRIHALVESVGGEARAGWGERYLAAGLRLGAFENMGGAFYLAEENRHASGEDLAGILEERLGPGFKLGWCELGDLIEYAKLTYGSFGGGPDAGGGALGEAAAVRAAVAWVGRAIEADADREEALGFCLSFDEKRPYGWNPLSSVLGTSVPLIRDDERRETVYFATESRFARGAAAVPRPRPALLAPETPIHPFFYDHGELAAALRLHAPGDPPAAAEDPPPPPPLYDEAVVEIPDEPWLDALGPFTRYDAGRRIGASGRKALAELRASGGAGEPLALARRLRAALLPPPGAGASWLSRYEAFLAAELRARTRTRFDAYGTRSAPRADAVRAIGAAARAAGALAAPPARAAAEDDAGAFVDREVPEALRGLARPAILEAWRENAVLVVDAALAEAIFAFDGGKLATLLRAEGFRQEVEAWPGSVEGVWTFAPR